LRLQLSALGVTGVCKGGLGFRLGQHTPRHPTPATEARFVRLPDSK